MDFSVGEVDAIFAWVSKIDSEDPWPAIAHDVAFAQGGMDAHQLLSTVCLYPELVTTMLHTFDVDRLFPIVKAFADEHSGVTASPRPRGPVGHSSIDRALGLTRMRTWVAAVVVNKIAGLKFPSCGSPDVEEVLDGKA